MKPPLLIVAGAKGAVGSTVAVAVADLRRKGKNILPWLTTTGWIETEILAESVFTGWDGASETMTESLFRHAVLFPDQYQRHAAILDSMAVRFPPSGKLSLKEQVGHLAADIRHFVQDYPNHQPVLVNLLPACEPHDLKSYQSLKQLYRHIQSQSFPDLAYILAAIDSGLPIVNFTSNTLEVPMMLREAHSSGVPWCGRDGKTGQTYLKMVIASALRARLLFVDGWYSLNILGNEDGRNLSDPRKASGKLANKTDFLDTILGYPVGKNYGQSTHKVAIEFYPPRGDSKESWDVIDMKGIFGMPMSIRMNMQLRDSILAAPMVIDLVVWMAVLKEAGRTGFVPELAFYFKKAPLPESPVTFQEQIAALQNLMQHLK